MNTLPISPTIWINELGRKKIEAGEVVYHLGFGEARFPVHPRIQQALAQNTHRHSYQETFGLKDLRENISRHMEKALLFKVRAEDIFIAPGSKLALYAFLMLLEGDLLQVTPSWVSYAPQAQILGKAVIAVVAEAKNGYFPTFEQLEEAILRGRENGARPTILVISSPNNPTGAMITQAQINEIAQACKKYDITVISDEIYGEVVHPGEQHLCFANTYERTLTTGGVSKQLSLGGYRLGWGILPQGGESGFRDNLRALISETWTAVAAPIQYALADCFGAYGELKEHVALCNLIHSVRAKMAWRILERAGAKLCKPQGAFYLYPDFTAFAERLSRTHGVETSNDLAKVLLEKSNTLALPGIAFGEQARLTLRLALSYPDMETTELSQSFYDQARAAVETQDAQKAEKLIEENSPNLKQGIENVVALFA